MKRYLSFFRITEIFGLFTLFTFLSGAPASAQGIWNDGQDAASVLGQLDFESGQANQGNGSPNASSLDTVFDVAVDVTSGKVFVSDQGNNRILRFSSSAALQNGSAAEAVLGQASFTASGSGTTSSSLDSPGGIWVNSMGTLWVCDTGNNRVLRFDDASTKGSGDSADGVLGQANFTSSNAATTQNGMISPSSVVEDSAGRLWVVDTGNNRVLRFNSAALKANGTNADAVLGQPDFTTASFDTTSSNMNSPSAIAAGLDGSIWVADRGNHRVLKFENASSKGSGAAADGVLGKPDFVSGMPFEDGPNRFFAPGGLALDSAGTLWVGDSNNSRVLRFDDAANKENGADADGVLGEPNFVFFDPYSADRSSVSPFGLCSDGNNRLWVADIGGNRVLRFEADLSSVRAALNSQIRSTSKKIRKLKKKIKKAKQKKQKAKERRLKRQLKKKKRDLRRLRARLAAL